MTPDEFQSTAIAILRSAVGWQSAIAERLGVNRRAVTRWLTEGSVPDWAAGKLSDMAGGTDRGPWPRDEWVNGDAVDETGRRREYIVHIQPPRFVARVVELDEYGDPEPGEAPADILSGMVYSAGPLTLLCEIEWWDEVRPGEHAKWLDAAADALDRTAHAG